MNQNNTFTHNVNKVKLIFQTLIMNEQQSMMSINP